MVSSQRSFIRSVALTLIFCLFFQEFSYGLTEVLKPQDPHEADLAWARCKLSGIPESVATIEDAWRSELPASSFRLVILVQDAHTNPSAQINESKLLDHLLKKTDAAGTIFLEAGEGDESLSFLRPYASLEKRTQGAKSFLAQGRLQGVEYLDLTSDHKLVLYGVEDMELYSKAVELYRKVRQKRERFQDYLAKIENTVETLRPQVLNPFLLEFDNERRKFLKDQISFHDYLSSLFVRSGKLDSRFKHLKKLKSLKDKEAKVDFVKASDEQERLVFSLPEAERTELMGALKRGDRKVRDAFYCALAEKIKDPSLTPNLARYLSYLKEARSLDPKGVLEEQKALEKQVVDSLTDSEEEKEFLAIANLAGLFQKMTSLQMTPEEFEEYRTKGGSDPFKKVTGFLNKMLLQRKTRYDKALFLEEGYEDMARLCAEFYELTAARDRKFIENMLPKLDPKAPNILITGGYHAPNLKSLLKKENISYISVTPQILEETNIKRYEEILLKQRLPAFTAAPSPAALNTLRLMRSGLPQYVSHIVDDETGRGKLLALAAARLTQPNVSPKPRSGPRPKRLERDTLDRRPSAARLAGHKEKNDAASWRPTVKQLLVSITLAVATSILLFWKPPFIGDVKIDPPIIQAPAIEDAEPESIEPADPETEPPSLGVINSKLVDGYTERLSRLSSITWKDAEFTGVYLRSNEEHLERLILASRTMGGVKFGTSFQQSIDMAVAGDTDEFIFTDISPAVTDIAVPFFGVLSESLHTPRDLLSYLLGVHLTEKEFKDLLNPPKNITEDNLDQYLYEKISKILEKRSIADRKEWFEKQILPLYTKLMFPVLAEHGRFARDSRDEVIKLGTAFSFFLNAFHPDELGKPHHLENRGLLAVHMDFLSFLHHHASYSLNGFGDMSWLTLENYQRFSRMWKEGRLSGATVDFTDFDAMQRVAKSIATGKRVTGAYFSNVAQYQTDKGVIDMYVHNLDPFPWHSEAFMAAAGTTEKDATLTVLVKTASEAIKIYREQGDLLKAGKLKTGRGNIQNIFRPSKSQIPEPQGARLSAPGSSNENTDTNTKTSAFSRRFRWVIGISVAALLIGSAAIFLSNVDLQLRANRQLNKAAKRFQNEGLRDATLQKHIDLQIRLAKQDIMANPENKGLKEKDIRAEIVDGLFIELRFPQPTSKNGARRLYDFVVHYEVNLEANTLNPRKLGQGPSLRIPEDPVLLQEYRQTAIEDLKDPDENTRIQTVRDIGDLGVKDINTTRALIEVIQDKSLRIREMALFVLADAKIDFVPMLNNDEKNNFLGFLLEELKASTEIAHTGTREASQRLIIRLVSKFSLEPKTKEAIPLLREIREKTPNGRLRSAVEDVLRQLEPSPARLEKTAPDGARLSQRRKAAEAEKARLNVQRTNRRRFIAGGLGLLGLGAAATYLLKETPPWKKVHMRSADDLEGAKQDIRAAAEWLKARKLQDHMKGLGVENFDNVLDDYQKAVLSAKPHKNDSRGKLSKYYEAGLEAPQVFIHPGEIYHLLTDARDFQSSDVYLVFAAIIAREAWGVHLMQSRYYLERYASFGIKKKNIFNEYSKLSPEDKSDWRSENTRNFLNKHREDLKEIVAFIISMEIGEALVHISTARWAEGSGIYKPERISGGVKQKTDNDIDQLEEYLQISQIDEDRFPEVIAHFEFQNFIFDSMFSAKALDTTAILYHLYFQSQMEYYDRTKGKDGGIDRSLFEGQGTKKISSNATKDAFLELLPLLREHLKNFGMGGKLSVSVDRIPQKLLAARPVPTNSERLNFALVLPEIEVEIRSAARLADIREVRNWAQKAATQVKKGLKVILDGNAVHSRLDLDELQIYLIDGSGAPTADIRRAFLKKLEETAPVILGADVQDKRKSLPNSPYDLVLNFGSISKIKLAVYAEPSIQAVLTSVKKSLEEAFYKFSQTPSSLTLPDVEHILFYTASNAEIKDFYRSEGALEILGSTAPRRRHLKSFGMYWQLEIVIKALRGHFEDGALDERILARLQGLSHDVPIQPRQKPEYDPLGFFEDFKQAGGVIVVLDSDTARGQAMADQLEAQGFARPIVAKDKKNARVLSKDPSNGQQIKFNLILVNDSTPGPNGFNDDTHAGLRNRQWFRVVNRYGKDPWTAETVMDGWTQWVTHQKPQFLSKSASQKNAARASAKASEPIRRSFDGGRLTEGSAEFVLNFNDGLTDENGFEARKSQVRTDLIARSLELLKAQGIDPELRVLEGLEDAESEATPGALVRQGIGESFQNAGMRGKKGTQDEVRTSVALVNDALEIIISNPGILRTEGSTNDPERPNDQARFVNSLREGSKPDFDVAAAVLEKFSDEPASAESQRNRYGIGIAVLGKELAELYPGGLYPDLQYLPEQLAQLTSDNDRTKFTLRVPLGPLRDRQEKFKANHLVQSNTETPPNQGVRLASADFEPFEPLGRNVGESFTLNGKVEIKVEALERIKHSDKKEAVIRITYLGSGRSSLFRRRAGGKIVGKIVSTGKEITVYIVEAGRGNVVFDVHAPKGTRIERSVGGRLADLSFEVDYAGRRNLPMVNPGTSGAYYWSEVPIDVNRGNNRQMLEELLRRSEFNRDIPVDRLEPRFIIAQEPREGYRPIYAGLAISILAGMSDAELAFMRVHGVTPYQFHVLDFGGMSEDPNSRHIFDDYQNSGVKALGAAPRSVVITHKSVKSHRVIVEHSLERGLITLRYMSEAAAHAQGLEPTTGEYGHYKRYKLLRPMSKAQIFMSLGEHFRFVDEELNGKYVVRIIVGEEGENPDKIVPGDSQDSGKLVDTGSEITVYYQDPIELEVLNLDIDAIGISTAITHLLRQEDIISLYDLTRWSARDLSEIDGIDHEAIILIKEALASLGFSLAEDGARLSGKKVTKEIVTRFMEQISRVVIVGYEENVLLDPAGDLYDNAEALSQAVLEATGSNYRNVTIEFSKNKLELYKRIKELKNDTSPGKILVITLISPHTTEFSGMDEMEGVASVSLNNLRRSRSKETLKDELFRKLETALAKDETAAGGQAPDAGPSLSDRVLRVMAPLGRGKPIGRADLIKSLEAAFTGIEIKGDTLNGAFERLLDGGKISKEGRGPKATYALTPLGVDAAAKLPDFTDGPPVGRAGARLSQSSSEDEAIDFLMRVFATQKRAGRIVVDLTEYELQRSGDKLIVRRYGREIIRTAEWNKVVSGSPEETESGEYQIPMGDLRVILSQAFEAAGEVHMSPIQDKKNALSVINLTGFDPNMKGMRELVIPYLAKEIAYATRQGYGTNALFLIEGSDEIKAMVRAALEEEGAAKEFVFTDRSEVPAGFEEFQAAVTDPANPVANLKNLYTQIPQEGDIPNFRALIKLSLKLARIEKLDASNGDFLELLNDLKILLGWTKDVDIPNFRDAITAATREIDKRYVFSMITRVPLNAVFAAARLALAMTEQSA